MHLAHNGHSINVSRYYHHGFPHSHVVKVYKFLYNMRLTASDELELTSEITKSDALHFQMMNIKSLSK